MTVEQWLGENNQIGIDIWKHKYCFNNETFDEWLDRVSSGNEEVKQLIIDKKFLFGGRILSNRGLQKGGLKVTYSNCYVLSPPEDNIESIFECASKLARTFSYGGGCGIDISKLSPKGVKVNNTAKVTSGAVSFMDLFSTVTGLIGQNGRRGALMISLDCTHPDLEDFIAIKSDLDRVTKANISIRISDAFMNAVKNDEGWRMSFKRGETGEEVAKTVRARDLFHKIAEMNWNYAEPGALFWDRISNYNLLSNTEGFEYAGTNPSLRKGTLILTNKGIVPIEELEGKEFKVPNLNGEWSTAKCFLSGHDKILYKITLDNGKTYYSTKEHKWPIRMPDNSVAKLVTSELKKGYEIPTSPITSLNYGEGGTYDDGLLCGFLYADGSITVRSDNGKTQYGFTFGAEKIKYLMNPILDKLSDISGNIYNPTKRNRGQEDWYEVSTANSNIDKYFVSFGIKDKEHLPDKWNTDLSEDFRKGFIDGLFSADASIELRGKDQCIQWSNKSRAFAEQIRDYLMWYGIRCSIHRRKSILNGKEFEANIIKISKGSAYHFRKTFKLTNVDKQERLSVIKKPITHKAYSQFVKISNMEETNIQEDVWDITVFDTTHCFRLNGCITGNCAEEPLPAGGSCLLGSINLSEFVTDNKFDFDGFKQTVMTSVLALNEVLDEGLPLHPLNEQINSVRDWRQIGLGVMGIADMLIKMEIPYGSEASLELCDKIAFTMINSAIFESAILSGYDDCFPKYNRESIASSEFYKFNTTDDVKKTVNDLGIRNSQLLTIAPTGTLSTMLGISGGIEPVFANYYTRKTESLHDKDVYYKVYTPIVEQYMKTNNIGDDSNLPDWFVTAQTLNYKDRIAMQSVWQSHIDASISSTVNVPNEFTVEETEELYMKAWKNGLKGITIFRDGCKRAGILTFDNTSENTDSRELKRGDILQVNDDVIGKKRKLITGCGTLHCTAFFDPVSGDLVETYLSKGSTGGCNNFMIGLSRMISLSARSGCDVNSIVDQLNSCGVCPSYAVRNATRHDTSKGSCCPIAIANALLDMWEEVQDELGNEMQSNNPTNKKISCPQCGENLVFEGGCNICKACGWSKCS